MNMRLKRLAFVLAVVFVVGTIAPALAKSPFADVPADHWAYDSIVQLAATGLIEGYPDGTFGGARMMTRYEAAMVFARALTRLESRIAETNVLDQLDAIKAELIEVIKAELAALDVPVETTVLERIVVDKDMDEATLERLRQAELGLEILDGDLAYVEHRVLGLIDGIRYDLDQLQVKLDGLEAADEPVVVVEQPSLDEIEELIAARIEEALLEVAAGAGEVVHETTIITKFIEPDTPPLTEADVEAIAQALITQQLSVVEGFVAKALRENRVQDERLDALEVAQAETEAALAALQEGGKLGITGSLSSEVVNDSGAWDFGHGYSLALSVKASDTVNAKVSLGGGVGALLGAVDTLDYLTVDVTSDTLLKRVIGGYRPLAAGDVSGRFSTYALAVPGGPRPYRAAGVADLAIIDGLDVHFLLASATANPANDISAALGLKFDIVPALKLAATVATGVQPGKASPDMEGVHVGLSGDVFGVGYYGDFAMDLGTPGVGSNMLFGGGLNAELGFLGLNGSFYMAQDNYLINRPFIDGASTNVLEVGASADIIPQLKVDGGFYREADAAQAATIQAFRFGASADFKLGIPFGLSAEYASNERATQNTHMRVGLTLGPPEPELGFHYGANYAYVKGEYAGGGNWKNGGFAGTNAHLAGANLKYKADVGGAVLGVGYGANFRMPFDPAGNNILTHSVDLGYDFTDNVGVTLGAVLSQDLTAKVNSHEYKAGFSLSF